MSFHRGGNQLSRHARVCIQRGEGRHYPWAWGYWHIPQWPLYRNRELTKQPAYRIAPLSLWATLPWSAFHVSHLNNVLGAVGKHPRSNRISYWICAYNWEDIILLQDVIPAERAKECAGHHVQPLLVVGTTGLKARSRSKVVLLGQSSASIPLCMDVNFSHRFLLSTTLALVSLR